MRCLSPPCSASAAGPYECWPRNEPGYCGSIQPVKMWGVWGGGVHFCMAAHQIPDVQLCLVTGSCGTALPASMLACLLAVLSSSVRYRR